MKVDVAQKNVSLTRTQDGSECQPGRVGLKKVEFWAVAKGDERTLRIAVKGVSRLRRFMMIVMIPLSRATT